MNENRPRARPLPHHSLAAALAAAVVVTMSPARSVRAETAVLLSPRGNASASERERAQLVVAQALTAQATRVVPLAQAAADAPGMPERACDALACAPGLLRASGADVAVVVAVRTGSASSGATTVSVTLADRRGDRYPGKAEIEQAGARGLARAVERALLDARGLQLLGPGPWLSVHGEPQGADVLLDGSRVGAVPHRAKVPPGRHTLEVRSDGHRPHVQTVDVPNVTTEQTDVEVALAPRGSIGGPESSRDHDERGARPVVGPLILGGAGALLIATDVALVLGSGCERRNSLGHCVQGGEIDEAWAIGWAGVGAAAIVGAVFWHVLGQREPADLSMQAGPGRASLVLSGAF